MSKEARQLTPTEVAILAPLYARRDALRREGEAVDAGIVAAMQALHGAPEPGLSLQSDGNGGLVLMYPSEEDR
jgi:hypothetical protein